ncbi:uncharacterized protein LOC112906526 [Agrilus planipennis]|uniref:Uncharacterized protein LOC112906526 n=1 Tax=Agrilus planipennis TaxID=224129 RepID=A0A7F5RL60_AGRPL|nr:uncharacterized protein LOC112906526 [Agrilus planipennis]
MALKRLFAMERKLNRDSNLKSDYIKFLTEYEQLGHMSKISENEIQGPRFYLPHHAVFKQSSTTTKLRVVFDASAKTTSGISLNDIQYTGPTIQSDLLSILLRFRQHDFVITADITKMYRQILVDESQRNLQLILWRPNQNRDVDCFRLNTITYGTAAASFLATRCLNQLALEHENQFPLESHLIKNDFYMDDLLTGSNSETELMAIQGNISKILKSAGFELCKWTSNSQTVIENINKNQKTTDNLVKFQEKGESKTLGILWNPNNDNFQYNERIIYSNHVTKRTILSNVAQIFDPLGLLAPIIVIAKLIIQDLWQLKLSWDQSIPLDIHTKWCKYSDQLKFIRHIQIPRQVICRQANMIELHGFSDASEKAYGACVYIRSRNNSGLYTVSLLCAKSRVAPLKNISLPRLELCGALLLARLVARVKDAIKINFNRHFYWCDSTITLAWIAGPPNKWKTFVANRVSEIHNLTDQKDWVHVSTKHNPADLISRGVESMQLANSSMWWNGPPWLLDDIKNWPISNIVTSEAPEQRVVAHASVLRSEFSLFSKFSDLNKLTAVTAYCLRFIGNARTQLTKRKVGTLSTTELQNALLILIRNVQESVYFEEKHLIKSGKQVGRKSKLLSLHPFCDQDGLLRVGGRIENANFSYDKKHPIILPPKHHLTRLIIEHEHKRLLHCGPNQVLASLRDKYWPISAKGSIRQIIHKCLKCYRVNPKPFVPFMGSLPKSRLTPAPPFYNCGIDYAGPIYIKEKRGRSNKEIKAYMCIIVCFVTKAIHLDLVTSLTAEACVAMLRRFISRRGQPLNIYSDNGLSFVGANSELNEFYKMLNNPSNSAIINNIMNKSGITWHFIPPRSPHFGGLWEAGVKSVKNHLKRVVGNTKLTFEEFYTLLTQIEAVLNSRPLSPLSNDPTELEPLTPAHFLIGRKLTAMPEPSLLDIKESRLNKFQHIQKMQQDFWKRWSKEYVHQLQTRSKWKETQQCSIKSGVLVLIKEDNLPPLKWQLGRVVDVHPGSDDVIRVVSVKVSNGKILKRAVTKICVLPMDM